MRPGDTWTDGPPCLAPDEGLHEAVARNARLRPSAVAVAVAGSGERMTYGELDATADAWAASLTAAGVRSGDLVPILMPRSTELVIGLLAVLKTGAAYSVLDREWPISRMRDVVDLLDARLLVTAAGLAVLPGLPVWSPPPAETCAFSPVPVQGTHPCTVFFTSGTTGRPKGVVSSHQATARLFQKNGFLPFTDRTVMALAAAVAWDAFSLELWSVLLNGGTTVVVREPYLSSHSLRCGIAEHGVNTVWATSSLFSMLVDEDLDAFEGLQHVLVGGERLSPPHVAAFLRRHPRIVLLNGYGPVESTVFATTHRIVAADVERPDGIPLGRPVPGTRLRLMDGIRPCTAGEVGEILIAGSGLVNGYLGDDALIDAKFTRLTQEARSERFYRSGDLGVLDDSGVLHYRGRADRQVKVRGHRVEPAEVERQVEQLLSAVRQCRVLARPADGGAARELVAFCVPATPGDPLDTAYDVLRSRLVAHHRPAAVVSVPTFPLTAQGKLDERALLAAVPVTNGHRASGLNSTEEEPTGGDGTHRLVAAAFREVIGTLTVPHNVSFFELGGTSLGAGRVCARLSEGLGRLVPVSLLYRRTTVSGLADLLRQPTSGSALTVPSDASTDTDPFPDDGVPLSAMQLVFLSRQLASPADGTSHCLLAWSLEGELDLYALQAAVEKVHLLHEPLSALYVADPHPAVWLDDVPPPELTALPAADTVDAALQALRCVLAEPLDPGRGRIWRTALVAVRDTEVTLFGCAIHHIAFDGWSEAVLAGDLSSAYSAARGRPGTPGGTPPSLEHSHRLCRRGASAEEEADLADQRRYLTIELEDVPQLRWPAGPTERAGAGPARWEAVLEPAAVAAVDAAAAQAGATRFEALLSRWARSVSAVTGQYDFAIGFPFAQRDRAELRHSIGCHMTMVCVRMRGAAVDADGVAAEDAAVRETARLVRRALAAQDVPFHDLLALDDRPRAGRPPLFQTLFALQDNTEPRLHLDGLRTTFLRQPYVQLPLELHAELWPCADGGLRIDVAYQPDVVPAAVARQLLDRFMMSLYPNSVGVS